MLDYNSYFQLCNLSKQTIYIAIKYDENPDPFVAEKQDYNY